MLLNFTFLYTIYSCFKLKCFSQRVLELSFGQYFLIWPSDKKKLMVSNFNSSTTTCIIYYCSLFKFQDLISMYINECSGMTENCFISFNLEIEYPLKVDMFCKVQLGYVPYLCSTSSDDVIKVNEFHIMA